MYNKPAYVDFKANKTLRKKVNEWSRRMTVFKAVIGSQEI